MKRPLLVAALLLSSCTPAPAVTSPRLPLTVTAHDPDLARPARVARAGRGSRPVLPVPVGSSVQRAHLGGTRTGRAYPASRAEVIRLIRAAAVRAGISPDGLVALAWCESRLHPDSRSSCCLGLFQQHERYIAARFARYGRAGRSWADPEAQSHVAASMIRDGQLSAWSCAGAYRRAA